MRVAIWYAFLWVLRSYRVFLSFLPYFPTYHDMHRAWDTLACFTSPALILCDIGLPDFVTLRLGRGLCMKIFLSSPVNACLCVCRCGMSHVSASPSVGKNKFCVLVFVQKMSSRVFLKSLVNTCLMAAFRLGSDCFHERKWRPWHVHTWLLECSLILWCTCHEGSEWEIRRKECVCSLRQNIEPSINNHMLIHPVSESLFVRVHM